MYVCMYVCDLKSCKTVDRNVNENVNKKEFVYKQFICATISFMSMNGQTRNLFGVEHYNAQKISYLYS